MFIVKPAIVIEQYLFKLFSVWIRNTFHWGSKRYFRFGTTFSTFVEQIYGFI